MSRSLPSRSLLQKLTVGSLGGRVGSGNCIRLMRSNAQGTHAKHQRGSRSSSHGTSESRQSQPPVLRLRQCRPRWQGWGERSPRPRTGNRFDRWPPQEQPTSATVYGCFASRRTTAVGDAEAGDPRRVQRRKGYGRHPRFRRDGSGHSDRESVGGRGTGARRDDRPMGADPGRQHLASPSSHFLPLIPEPFTGATNDGQRTPLDG